MRPRYASALVVALALALLAALAGGWWVQSRLRAAQGEVTALQRQVVTTSDQLLGYTRYTTYLTAGQNTLAEQMKLLTATVVREEGATQIVEKSVLGLASTGVVAVWYTAEYAFGYDLRPGSYALKDTPQGLEVHLARPALVATPAVSQLRHRVLSGGLLTDEKSAVIRLQEEAARRAQAQGIAMAAEPAVVALCEKSLTGFLADFLARQPGVKAVPRITVVYPAQASGPAAMP
ncbi:MULTISPECIES: hypothetical protein [unclassified Acidovorax]|uniref:hypothetical protein n=1 Tax=unclassified Acidovorax TaxID=2684926 RepID=UPI002882E532|nr:MULTISPECIES: hypothetical protein [unclassified Acidovorax]